MYDNGLHLIAVHAQNLFELLPHWIYSVDCHSVWQWATFGCSPCAESAWIAAPLDLFCRWSFCTTRVCFDSHPCTESVWIAAPLDLFCRMLLCMIWAIFGCIPCTDPAWIATPLDLFCRPPSCMTMGYLWLHSMHRIGLDCRLTGSILETAILYDNEVPLVAAHAQNLLELLPHWIYSVDCHSVWQWATFGCSPCTESAWIAAPLDLFCRWLFCTTRVCFDSHPCTESVWIAGPLDLFCRMLLCMIWAIVGCIPCTESAWIAAPLDLFCRPPSCVTMCYLWLHSMHRIGLHCRLTGSIL